MDSILSLNSVSKSFGGINALSDVSLDVKSGEILGIIGPNGAGKSTLFNVICGVYHADKGNIDFEGRPIGKLMPHQVCRRGIGRTFQLAEVFKTFTALECVALAAGFHMPLKEARRSAMELLEKFGMADKADWPCSDLTPVDVKFVELSKAIATQPRLILLDEAMSGLTHVEAQPVLEQIRKLPERGVTPVIVEHGMHIITAICERVIVLNFGQKIADGTPEQVLKEKTVVDSYLGEEIAGA